MPREYSIGIDLPMELTHLIDKALPSIIITVIYFLIYKYRYRFSEAFKDKKSIKFIEQFLGISIKLFVLNFRLKDGSLKNNIFTPMLLVLSIDGLIIVTFWEPMLPPDYPLWYLILSSGFFSPIFEEIFFRGFLLGTFLLTYLTFFLEKANKKPLSGLPLNLWLGFILIIQALIFALLHENPTLISLSVRIMFGLLYGSIYLRNRNLLSVFIAHMTHNNLVILIGVILGISFI